MGGGLGSGFVISGPRRGLHVRVKGSLSGKFAVAASRGVGCVFDTARCVEGCSRACSKGADPSLSPGGSEAPNFARPKIVDS